MGYGENGSVIGPQNVPTTDVASGVWSLGEVAEASRDSIWPQPYIPGYVFFGSASPAAGTAGPVTISNIPQNARDLVVYSRVIIQNSSVRLVISPNSTSITNNDFGLLVTSYAVSVGTAAPSVDETRTSAISAFSAGDANSPLEQVSTIFNYSSTTKEKTIYTEGSTVAHAYSDTSGLPWWTTTQFAGLGSTAITSLSFIFDSSSTYGYSMSNAFAVYGLGSAA